MKEITRLILAKKFYIYFVSTLVLILALVTLGYQLWNYIQSADAPKLANHEIETELPELSNTKEATTVSVEQEVTFIMVDIGGAVQRPGVYALPENSYLADLVQKAGGFRTDVLDSHLVQKQLNLAQILKNGEKYYIPYRGETWSSTGTNASNVTTSSNTSASTGLISVNNADSATLQTLKGIGESRAQAIIDNRPYTVISDLVAKGAITQSVFNNIQDLISI